MKSHIYIEKRIGRSQRVFELSGRTLRVEVLPRSNTTPEEFDLAKVAPNFTREKIMNVAALSRAGTYLAIVWSTAIVARGFASDWVIWISALALLLSYPGIYVILYFIRPVEVVRFKDAKGEILFDFMSRKENVGDLERFLVALNSAIASDSNGIKQRGDV